MRRLKLKIYDIINFFTTIVVVVVLLPAYMIGHIPVAILNFVLWFQETDE